MTAGAPKSKAYNLNFGLFYKNLIFLSILCLFTMQNELPVNMNQSGISLIDGNIMKSGEIVPRSYQ